MPGAWSCGDLRRESDAGCGVRGAGCGVQGAGYGVPEWGRMWNVGSDRRGSSQTPQPASSSGRGSPQAVRGPRVSSSASLGFVCLFVLFTERTGRSSRIESMIVRVTGNGGRGTFAWRASGARGRRAIVHAVSESAREGGKGGGGEGKGRGMEGKCGSVG
ncbi:hypothetical protein BC628DRAFT_1029509 [Trametes gibbosa]|nr:hypothetical protein BC628DRAFT_1029509 [Trametes gibbosa]